MKNAMRVYVLNVWFSVTVKEVDCEQLRGDACYYEINRTGVES